MFMDDISCAHPSLLLPPNAVTVIRDAAHAAELKGRLLPEQLEIIISHNWYQVFVPESLGGLNTKFICGVRLLEAFAWADGSFGWTVTLCSGANWFVGFFDEHIKQRFFKGNKTCLAGSGAPGGKAVATGKGYTVNGEWKYITGAPFATAFTANCIMESGEAAEISQIKPFIFTPEEVQIKEDWYGVGMKATASYTMVIKDLYVEKERMFELEDAQPNIDELLYKLPFLQFAEITLAANFSGMGFRFIELTKALLDEKIKQRGYNVEQASEMLEALGRVTTKFDQLRDDFFDIVNEAWHYATENNVWEEGHLKQISSASYALAKESVKAADLLYPYCGMTAADTRSEINRVWRDLHTASQHALFMFK